MGENPETVTGLGAKMSRDAGWRTPLPPLGDGGVFINANLLFFASYTVLDKGGLPPPQIPIIADFGPHNHR